MMLTAHHAIDAPSAVGLSPADALAEQLHRLRQGTSAAGCYLLRQQPEHDSEIDLAFDDIIVSQSIDRHSVALSGLPQPVWPSLIKLDLARGVHAHAAHLAVQMACEDMGVSALRDGRPTRACAWIFSDLPAAALAHHISTRSLRYAPKARGKRWIRHYVPSVTDVFWQFCDSDYRAWHLQDIQRWVFNDRWGALTTLQTPDQPASSPLAPPPVTEMMWRHLDTVGALNQAWIQAAIEGVTITPLQWTAAIDATAYGHGYGLRDRADFDLFAWHALQIGAGFHRHRLMRPLFAQVGSSRSYHELVDALDPAHWQTIADELPAATALQQPVSHHDKEFNHG